MGAAVAMSTLSPRQLLAQVRAALIREMDSPIRGTRQMMRFTRSYPPGSGGSSGDLIPNVPAGKRFFLQSIFVQSTLNAGQRPVESQVVLIAGGGPSDDIFWIPQTFQGAIDDIPIHFYTGNVTLNVLLNPGERIHFQFLRSDGLGAANTYGVEAEVIGYLVDATP